MTPQPSHRDRWLALFLLLGVLGIVYLLLVHPLWTRPLLEVNSQIASQQERWQRIHAQLQQASQVEQRLQQAQQALAGQPAFMPETSAGLASSRLVKRLEEVTRQVSPDNRSCAISNRSPLPPDASGRFVRIAVQARVQCGMTEWMEMLHLLETGVPRLNIDRLDIIAAPKGTSSGNGLEVSFELSGYLSPGAASPAAKTDHAQ